MPQKIEVQAMEVSVFCKPLMRMVLLTKGTGQRTCPSVSLQDSCAALVRLVKLSLQNN
jgi:hypothetical protein